MNFLVQAALSVIIDRFARPYLTIGGCSIDAKKDILLFADKMHDGLMDFVEDFFDDKKDDPPAVDPRDISWEQVPFAESVRDRIRTLDRKLELPS